MRYQKLLTFIVVCGLGLSVGASEHTVGEPSIVIHSTVVVTDTGHQLFLDNSASIGINSKYIIVASSSSNESGDIKTANAIITPKQAAKTAMISVDGAKILRVMKNERGDKYMVKVLTKSGHVRTILVDGLDGKVID